MFSQFKCTTLILATVVALIPANCEKVNTYNSNPIYSFATNLYLNISALKGQDENMLISPFSIRTIAALVYLASRGQTAEEIRHALLFPSNHDELVEGLAKHMGSTKLSKNSKFDIGNGIFIREGVYLNQTYSSLVRDKLYSHVQKCNFYEPQSSARIINTWVANITKNRIKNLVTPDALSSSTSVFMANALYFSGSWINPFDESSTIFDSFSLDNGKNIKVEMMQTEGTYKYNYIKELNATGISLPFQDNRFEFIILKPDGTLSDLERALRTYHLNLIPMEIRKQSRNVLLKMPKFKLDVHYDLVDAMKMLGINQLFTSRADLTGLTKLGDKHSVSQIVHQTALDIDEKGATATGATSVSFYPISSPSFFTLNKPFLFLLNDKLTGPLFIGRLANPISARRTENF